MSREQLRAVVGIITVLSAPILTGAVLSDKLADGVHEAGIALATLAWNQASIVLRSLFPGPEIDVVPPKAG